MKLSTYKLNFTKPCKCLSFQHTKRFFSSKPDVSSKDSISLKINPVPVLTLKFLNDKDYIDSHKEMLKNKGGIYSFINTVNGKKYIGSAKDFYLRLNEHLNNKKSNKILQNAFNKHGLDKFHWVIYEYFTYESKLVSNKALTSLETSYIKSFDFSTLYNFKIEATSMLGYIHTEETRRKMVERFKDKNNHPMYGKNHSKEALGLISKPGELNPMYGKTHSEETKKAMAKKKNKYLSGVGIFDLNNNLIQKFDNNVELAKFLGISKVTVGKYLNNNLIYKDTYIFKPIEP